MSWKLFGQIVLLMLIAVIILTGMKYVKKSMYRKCKLHAKGSHAECCMKK